jgi:hypothetical protein
MYELKLISWKRGLQTVSLIQAIKEHSTLSLIESKSEVEKLLAGNIVKLYLASETRRDEFKSIAKSLGVVFQEAAPGIKGEVTHAK